MGFYWDTLNKINSATDPAEINTYQAPSGWQRALIHIAGLDENNLEKARQAKLEELYAQTPEATALAKKLSDMQASGNSFDPNFTGQEWVRGMATTPALGGVMTEDQYDAQTGALPSGKKMVTVQGNNPVIARLLTLAEQQAQQKSVGANVANDILNMRNPDPIKLMEYQTGLGAIGTGEKGTGGSSNLDKIMALAKQTDEAKKVANIQQFLNAVGNANLADNEKLNALYKAAQYGMKPDDLKTVGENIGAVPKFDLVEFGAGGQNTIKGAFDPRTGKATNTIGEVMEPKPQNQVNVINNLPAQETAFAKGVGDANAKQYAGAIEQKQASEKAIATINDYLDATKKTYSGVGSYAQYLAAKANPVRSKQQQQAVENYEIAVTKSKEMAMDILTNFKGAISDGERIFAREMANNPSMDKKSQQRLADIAKRNHQAQIKKADTLIQAVENEPVRSNINKTLQDNKRRPLESFRR